MSLIALITGLVLAHVLIGIAAGFVMDPHGPWKQTWKVAAVGAGVMAGMIALSIFVVMAIHPTECAQGGHCHETDNQAAVQLIFVGVVFPVIYAFVLPGAALGRLAGRAIRRRAVA